MRRRAASGAEAPLVADVVVEQAKAGNRDAVSLLYREHVGIVYGYLRACGISDAEDLTSEVFVGMLRGLDRFNGDADDFRTWLMSITYRRMVDRRRRDGVRTIDPAEPESLRALADRTTSPYVAAEIDPRLIGAFSELTEEQRHVLALRFVADLGLERVAEVTGRPVGAVKSMQHRALSQLRKGLTESSLDALGSGALTK